MKKALVIILFLLFNHLLLRAQTIDSVRIFLDKSLETIQLNSINRDSIDWPALKKNVYEKAVNAKTYQEAAKVFPYIFEQIGDHHGALKLGKETYYWKTNEPYLNQTVKQAVKTHTQVSVQLLKGNIGYILLPGNSDFSGQQIDADTKEIRAAIATLNGKKIKGWILDLRVNTGGSMYQMLAGLAPILGDGKIGSFINQHQKNDGNWILRKGNIYLDSTQVSKLTEQLPSINQTLPLAVLISGITASSGEVTAISTIGRKKTVLIGERSAGYTTANEGFKINKYAGLNLAVDYDADRNGKIYKSFISPVILIQGGDNFSDIALDKKVMGAVNWIRKQH
ncbi:S41 family peptidase [Pedobacter miscanthi]|jgi:carboxyl-terminal processing protease|uniref:S41 family peptidase n=1 Tax=Pedobacter miscanthi TaxID=2259170 RepID=UPI00292EC071|nr:S41 family peptidase [Pedobacter miscanthi]